MTLVYHADEDMRDIKRRLRAWRKQVSTPMYLEQILQQIDLMIGGDMSQPEVRPPMEAGPAVKALHLLIEEIEDRIDAVHEEEAVKAKRA